MQYPRDMGGEQSLHITEKINIPLTMKHCMMTFTIRTPTEKEMDELEPFNITQDTIWRPTNYIDDPAQLFQQQVALLADDDDALITTQQAVLHTTLEDIPCDHLLVYNLHFSLDTHGNIQSTIKEPTTIPLASQYPSPIYHANNVKQEVTENGILHDRAHQAIPATVDYAQLSPNFAYRPIDVIRHTL